MKVVIDPEGKSSYHDGQVWVPIGGLENGVPGIWLKPDEVLAVVKKDEIPNDQ